jgi:hypothetical protein
MTGITGIFDGLYVDQLFHKNERGETVYYPFGVMGRGYLLPEARLASVKRATRGLMLASLIVGLSLGWAALWVINAPDPVRPMVWPTGLALFALLVGGITYLQSRLASGLEPVSGPRPGLGEWLRRGRQARAPWTSWVCLGLGLFCLLLAAFGIAFAIAEGTLGSMVAGGFFLVAGGLLTWDGALGILERKVD